MAVPQHIPLLLPPSPTRSSAENITWWSLRYLFDTVLGHLGAGLCQERVFLQTASSCSCLPHHPPQSNSWLTFPAIPRHTECWLYPSNSCPFFPEKEIDRNWFENVKPYQRPTVTPRQIFSGWCKCSISPRLFSQLTVWGVKPQINPQIFSGGRLEREVA